MSFEVRTRLSRFSRRGPRTPKIGTFARFLTLALVVVSAVLPAGLLAPSKAYGVPKDPRELRAREAFGAGRYRDALDLFVKLYGETLHPNYLRNIGRCQQNLNEIDPAISSFREYLRQAKNLKGAERAEVEGFIADLEAQKRRAQDKPGSLPPPPADSPQPPPPHPSPAVLSIPAPAEPAAEAVRLGPTQPTSTETPMYKTWWFWTGVGVVVAAGVTTVLVLGAQGGGRPPCPTDCM